jgi:hypothetical protein
MSNENASITTPVAIPAPAPAPAAKKGLTSAEILAKITGKSTTQQSEVAPPSSSSDAAPSTQADKPSSEPPSESAAIKPDHRTAQAILKAQKAEAEALKHRKAYEETTAKLKELEARLEAAKDPVKALALAGLDPIQFGEKMLKGEISAEQKAAVAELPSEVKELIAEAQARKAEEAKKAQEAERTQAFQATVNVVKGALDGVKAEFPALAALPFIPEQLAQVIDSKGGVESVSAEDFKSLCKQVQDHVVAEAAGMVKSPAVLAELLKLEGVKDSLLSALGAQPPAERIDTPSERTEGRDESAQRTLTNRNTSRVPSRAKGLTSADLANQINAKLFGK